MKIEISDENALFLKQLIEEIDAQDNRCTASPYYYVVQDAEERECLDGCGDYTKYFWDTELYTKGELLNEMSTKKLEERIDDGDIFPVELREEWTELSNSNVFFTEKACLQYMRNNGYHFRKPRSFVKHAWRNPEVTKLFEAVREIAAAINTNDKGEK